MKRQVIICGVLLVTAISTCFAAAAPAKKTKTAQNEAAIVRLEKIFTEAFKNKQVETVKKYLAPEFVGLDTEGFKNVDGDLADIPKYDVRDNIFANVKRVVRGEPDAQSPWEIASFLELKTVWHPVGQ